MSQIIFIHVALVLWEKRSWAALLSTHPAVILLNTSIESLFGLHKEPGHLPCF